MIAILGEFCQFSATKIGVHSETNVIIKFLQKLAVVFAQNVKSFAKFFDENILKNHSIGP
jgi:hypothetical protein